MAGLTADIGKFLADIRYEHLPEEVLPVIRDVFADTVGVTFAGVDQRVTKVLRKVIVDTSAVEEARVCLSSRRTTAPDAALVAGAIAHALDYGCQTASGHPGGVIVPAILAEAEVLGSTGKEMATAFIAGYEVWCEIWRRNKYYHKAGWHPTSVMGPVATAAACAVLRKLSAEKAQMAVAIAASHSGGVASNFGSMTKGYHSGMASRNGVIAARLAEAGLTGSVDAFENFKGFLTAFSSGGTPDIESPAQLGKEWYLPRFKMQFKRHPSCFFSHRVFEGTQEMLKGRPIDPEQVESVDVEMGRGQLTVLTFNQPQDQYQAQFSGTFGVAAAVILGKFGPAEIADEVVLRPDMQAFYPKVRFHAIDEEDPRDPVFSPWDRVVIKLKNGEVLDTGPIRTIPGYASQPLTTEELWGKFRDCTELTHTDTQAREMFDLLQKIDQLPNALVLPTCEKIFAD